MINQNLFNAKTSLKKSPFFKRTSLLNQSQEWRRWGGTLSAVQYELTHENEYFAIRTKAGLLDISPLYKYIITGDDSADFLDYIVTRNIKICKIGQVMYTPWCDEFGKVIDDGTVQRLAKDTFRLTSAEPNFEWLFRNSTGFDIEIVDDSNQTAALALQGPNSREILNSISSDSLESLKFFWLVETEIEGFPVTITRTGYTGDLGYEIWMNPEHALDIWDILLNADYGIVPVGLNALDMVRIEAGLILLDVDYISSRHAIIENQKSSPFELGLGWTVKLNEQKFIGSTALKLESESPTEWIFCGIEIGWDALEIHYLEVGLPPALPGTAWRASTPVYHKNKQVGYATSGTWSPILKKYIALAHIQADYAKPEIKLKIEIKVEHFRKLTPATIVKTPFYNPVRKRSCPE